MRVVPVIRARTMLTSKIGSNASSSPQMRIVIPGLPCRSWRSEAHHICGDHTHLLGMTISTSLSSRDLATMLFSSRQRLHGMWRRAFDLRLEFARGQNAEDHKGKDEKSQTQLQMQPQTHSQGSMEFREKYASSEQSRCQCLRCPQGCSRYSRGVGRAAFLGPVTSPIQNSRKPARIGMPDTVRVGQYGYIARTESIHGARLTHN
jgi:hypothetical protein